MAFLTEKSVQKVPLFKSGMPFLINFCPSFLTETKFHFSEKYHGQWISSAICLFRCCNEQWLYPLKKFSLDEVGKTSFRILSPCSGACLLHGYTMSWLLTAWLNKINVTIVIICNIISSVFYMRFLQIMPQTLDGRCPDHDFNSKLVLFSIF